MKVTKLNLWTEGLVALSLASMRGNNSSLATDETDARTQRRRKPIGATIAKGFNTVGVCLLAVAQLHQPAPAQHANGDCAEVLRYAGVDIVSFAGRRDLSAAIRTKLRSQKENNKSVDYETGASGSLGFKGLTLGLGSRRKSKDVESILERLQTDDSFVLGQSDAERLLIVTGNGKAIEAWLSCIKDSRRDLRLEVLPSKPGDTTLTFELAFEPQSGTKAVVRAVQPVGGTIKAQSVREGETLDPNSRHSFIIQAEPDQIVKLFIRCEPYSTAYAEGRDPRAAERARVEAERRAAIERARAKAEADRRAREAQERADREQREREECERQRRSYASGRDRLQGESGGEKRGRNVMAVCAPDERLSRIQLFYDYDNVKGVRIYGSGLNAGERLLGEVGGFEGNGWQEVSLALAEGEYLTQVTFQDNRYVDWIEFIGNRGSKGKIGGTPGRAGTPTLTAGDGRKIVGLSIWSSHEDVEGIQLVTEPIKH